MTADEADRSRLLHRAIVWSRLSVGWALFAGVTSIVAGLLAGSIALVGFGASSVVDGSASIVLIWRFHTERSEPHRVEQVEHLAARAIGVALLVVSTYLVVGAVISLRAGSGPERTPAGIALAASSMLVLPVLATRKIAIARGLRSRALRSDGVLSGAGALLAAATLAGLILDATLHWWWSDAVAALLIAAVLIREGVTVLRSPDTHPW